MYIIGLVVKELFMTLFKHVKKIISYYLIVFILHNKKVCTIIPFMMGHHVKKCMRK